MPNTQKQNKIDLILGELLVCFVQVLSFSNVCRTQDNLQGEWIHPSKS